MTIGPTRARPTDGTLCAAIRHADPSRHAAGQAARRPDATHDRHQRGM